MLGTKRPRKALIRALSQHVLASETIWRHAEAALRAPELVEASGQTSAFGLWTAVFRRAEGEGTVEVLVNSVLDENPAADELRAALACWAESNQRATAARQRRQPAPDTVGTRMSRATPVPARRRTAGLSLWLVPLFGAALLGWLLIDWHTLLERHDDDADEKEEASTLALEPMALLLRPGVEATEQDLEAALRTCWKRADGIDQRRALEAGGDTASRRMVKISLRLSKGASGAADGVEPSMTPRARVPHFKRCVRAASNALLARMAPGRSIEAEVQMPIERSNLGPQ
jgi:hypothetical protein